jgi:molecular chaperone DnaK
MGEQVDESSKGQIEAAIKEVRESLTSENTEEIKQKTQSLQEAFHRVSEQMYAAAAQQQAAAADGGGDGAEAATAAEGEEAADEEVVDAEVVDGDQQR